MFRFEAERYYFFETDTDNTGGMYCKVRIRILADIQKVTYRLRISVGRYICRSLV